MNVKEFIEESKKISNDSIKESRDKSLLNVKEYVGFAEKIALADRVVKICTNQVPEEDGSVGEFKINSATKYLLHVLGIIDLYTDLDIDYSNAISEYDMLAKDDYISKIIQLIGEREITECQMLLDFVYNDSIQNNLSPHAFIHSQIERFGVLTGSTIAPAIDALTKALENMDDKQIDKIVKAIGKFASK